MEPTRNMITAAQLRAARGLMDWTRSELAKHAGLSAETIKNIEHGVYMPQEATIAAVVSAFAEHDVEFYEDEGVKFHHDTVIKYDGVEGFKRFMDDVYKTARTNTESHIEKPFCMSHLDDSFFKEYLGDFFTVHHVKRMNALRDKFKMLILIIDKPETLSNEEYSSGSYREYRIQSEHAVGNVPFYVYGDKLAIIIFEEKKKPQIIVIDSPSVAKAYREQFNVLWNSSAPLTPTKTVRRGT